MIKTTLAKLATVKAAAIVAAASAGGVALAATTGVLPDPLTQDPPASHSTPGGDHAGQGTPSPSLNGLCTAFLAGAGADRGKALDNPAFTTLIRAAGNEDGVESYCVTLVASAPANASTDHPTGPPTSRPGNTPPPHPIAPPDTDRTGPATPSHPTPR